MISLLQRIARKSTSSTSYRSLGREGAYFILQSETVRESLGPFFLQRNDVDVVDYDELFNYVKNSDSCWRTFEENGATTEPIPKKTRVLSGTEFSDIEFHTPIRPAVLEIPDCRIVHPFGLTLQDGNLIQETISKSNSERNDINKAISKSLLDHGPLEIDALLANCYSSEYEKLSVATPLLVLWDNYYHWTLECLPRLAGIERYEKETGVEPTILIPEDPPSWMLESLEMLDVPPSRYKEFSTHCMVEKLVVATHPGPTPSECQWVREQMHAALEKNPVEDDTFSNRVFVSRKDATRRRIKNRKEVLELLQYYGFDEYELSELSVREQVSLFTNADVIVSPHGAGLANIIYSEPASIIELFGESKKTTYYRLAKLLDLDYHPIHNDRHLNDLVVDTSELEKKINRVCSK